MSSFEAIQRLADRYISDPEFRSQMVSDPEGVAKHFGVSLDDSTRQALRGVGAFSGQALSRRVSKGYRWC